MTHPPTPATLKFLRALHLACPRCGASGILKSWFATHSRCPSCDLALERGEGDFWMGAYVINLAVAESAAALFGALVLWATWPTTKAATITAISLAIALPMVFYPFSRTLWLAWDLSFRPSEPGDSATEP